MQTPYQLPNGDTAMVTDTATAAQNLGRAVELWRQGATEPLIYGDNGRPEGVVISFDQWAEYEVLREEAEGERRRIEIVRQRLADADDPSKWESFEDMMDRYGLDPDSPDLQPKDGGADDGDRKP
ncbi:hypothetical protein [Kribbella sp. NPDC048915]|uniref:hypothetical protein n=1 Tax=Kribbella sp. NPDC048915 TaxID=3155148 RepID=UPI003406B5AC